MFNFLFRKRSSRSSGSDDDALVAQPVPADQCTAPALIYTSSRPSTSDAGLDPSTGQRAAQAGEGMAQYRQRLLRIIQESISVSEREVFQAGRNVHSIVDEAKAYIGHIQGCMATLGRAGDGPDITEAIARQIDAVSAFIEKTNANIDKTNELASKALEQSNSILAAGRQVDQLAQTSKYLALNASIQAVRMGAEGGAFGVIAAQMKELSENVEAANRSVAQLAGNLLQLLPNIADRAQSMRRLSGQFSKALTVHIAQVEAGSDALKHTATEFVNSGDDRLARILDHSQRTLSHLQFQDPMAQNLQRLDTMFAQMQRSTSRTLDTEFEIAPPFFTALLGDELLETRPTTEPEESDIASGEVLLF